MVNRLEILVGGTALLTLLAACRNGDATPTEPVPIVTLAPTEQATPTYTPTEVVPIATPDAQEQTLLAILNGAEVIPPNPSIATGTGTFKINTNTKTLEYEISFSGMLGPDVETAAHIHLAPAGQNGPAVFNLPLRNTKRGTWNYPPDLEAKILAGETYVQIHSLLFPSGAIRGQILLTSNALLPVTPTPNLGAIPTPQLTSGWPEGYKPIINPDLIQPTEGRKFVEELSQDGVVGRVFKMSDGKLIEYLPYGFILSQDFGNRKMGEGSNLVSARFVHYNAKKAQSYPEMQLPRDIWRLDLKYETWEKDNNTGKLVKIKKIEMRYEDIGFNGNVDSIMERVWLEPESSQQGYSSSTKSRGSDNTEFRMADNIYHSLLGRLNILEKNPNISMDQKFNPYKYGGKDGNVLLPRYAPQKIVR